jgi:hypothetical protein
LIIKNWSVVLTHILLSAALGLITAYTGYRIFVHALETAEAEQVQAYMDVRAGREQTLFDEALELNLAAERVFRRRLEAMEDVDISAEFDRLFPVIADGTRRSIPELFDGMTLSDGDHVYGVGAFMGKGDEMNEDQKRLYLAAFHAVRSVGEAFLDQFESLYFFTPDRRVVIFGPHREDRLAFYRIDAPADFDLRGDDDENLFDRATNPDGQLQCTRLSRFVYSDGGERSASGCRLPIREANGRLLGGVGTSIMMTDYLQSALEFPPANGMNVLIDGDGQVLSRAVLDQDSTRSRVLEGAVDFNGLASRLRTDSRESGVVRDRRSGRLVGFSRISGPDWYFIAVVHNEALRGQALYWSVALFWVIFLSSAVVATLRGALVRLRPVRRLRRAEKNNRENDSASRYEFNHPEGDG